MEGGGIASGRIGYRLNADHRIDTPSLRGVKFFNLIDGTKLTAEEKQDLVAFLHAL